MLVLTEMNLETLILIVLISNFFWMTGLAVCWGPPSPLLLRWRVAGFWAVQKHLLVKTRIFAIQLFGRLVELLRQFCVTLKQFIVFDFAAVGCAEVCYFHIAYQVLTCTVEV